MKLMVYCGHVGAQGGYGGGEYHTFSFLKALDEHYEVLAVVERGVLPMFDKAREDYGLDLSNTRWVYSGVYDPREFDVFINISHFIKYGGLARLNVLVTFFPQYRWDVSDYQVIIANSKFCAWAVSKRWNRDDAIVIYPPINWGEFQPPGEKEKIILVVGRFFEVPSGNNKRHDVALELFEKLDVPGWELHLVGSVQHEDYFKRIKRQAEAIRKPIYFHHDLSRQDYINLMKRASILFSATGFEAQDISMAEHRGIIVEEAMAAGVAALVHDSGGMPEGGALTWGTKEEALVRLRRLCTDDAFRVEYAAALRQKAKEYDLKVIGRQLVEVLEEPRVIIGGDRAKIWPAVKPKRIKVAILSDSPTLTTGFGVVTKNVSRYWQEWGFELAAIGMLDTCPRPMEDPFPVWRPCEYDPSGLYMLEQFLDFYKPDVIYINYDPGTVQKIWQRISEWPVVVYFPIEGIPIPRIFLEMASSIKARGGECITYTQWGVEMFEMAGKALGLGAIRLRWAWHGVDREVFRRLPEEERRRLREQAGLDKFFVVMNVKRNKRTSNQGILIEAARWLASRGHTDFLFYIHTNPIEKSGYQPIPLLHLAESYNLRGMVRFPPVLFAQEYGVKEAGVIEGAIHPMAGYGLVERYNCADLYVAPESVEGFGLPLVEAMACGLPIVATYDGVRNEIVTPDVGVLLKPSAITHWHTGVRLAQISYTDLAQLLLRLREKGDILAKMSEASLKRAEDFNWEDCARVIAEAIEQVYYRHNRFNQR